MKTETPLLILVIGEFLDHFVTAYNYVMKAEAGLNKWKVTKQN